MNGNGGSDGYDDYEKIAKAVAERLAADMEREADACGQTHGGHVCFAPQKGETAAPHIFGRRGGGGGPACVGLLSETEYVPRRCRLEL